MLEEEQTYSGELQNQLQRSLDLVGKMDGGIVADENVASNQVARRHLFDNEDKKTHRRVRSGTWRG